MKRHVCVWMVPLLLAAGAGWAAVKAKPRAKPAPKSAEVYAAAMQAVGTFDESPPASKVTISAAPDEYEPASFVIRWPKAVSSVTVALSGDLVSGKNRLPASRAAISAVEGNRLSPVRPFDLTPGEAKRFWITFQVPEGARPGIYQGAVVATAGGRRIGRLPIELNVLGMRLVKSSKQYGVLLPYAGPGEPLLATLRAVRAGGFSLVSTGAPPEELPGVLAAIREAGFSYPVPYIFPGLTAEGLDAVREQARAVGSSRLLVCAAYEPRTQEQIDDAARLNRAIRAAGLSSFAVIDDPSAYEQLADSVDYLDDHVDLPCIRGLVSGNKPAPNRREWWYWDVTRSARDNRLYAGLLLWKSGLYGAFPPLSPGGPAEDGSVIGTIQWEALREGIDDTRYITSMMRVLREARDLHKAKATGDAAESFLTAALAKPLRSLTNRDVQGIRYQIAQYTVKLQKAAK